MDDRVCKCGKRCSPYPAVRACPQCSRVWPENLSRPGGALFETSKRATAAARALGLTAPKNAMGLIEHVLFGRIGMPLPNAVVLRDEPELIIDLSDPLTGIGVPQLWLVEAGLSPRLDLEDPIRQLCALAAEVET